MKVIRARNVHSALPLGLAYLSEVGVPMSSRAGNVIAAPGPVTTIYEHPCERVLFWPEREASPWLHFFESLWMLAGRNDLAFLTKFVKRFAEFSDDGKTLAGAYGARWRSHFGFDQIERIVALLEREPFSRRAVITMFDPRADLKTDETSLDIPCNTQLYFRVMYGCRDEPNRLDMMTTARSHDAIWGAMGANAVHFSYLQEYVAARLGLVVGTFTQVSWNYHAYEKVFAKTYRGDLAQPFHDKCPYGRGEVTTYPLVADAAAWDRDLALFLEAPEAYGFVNPFFSVVAKPMWWAHVAYKRGDLAGALEIIWQCAATDWRRVCIEWLERRRK